MVLRCRVGCSRVLSKCLTHVPGKVNVRLSPRRPGWGFLKKPFRRVKHVLNSLHDAGVSREAQLFDLGLSGLRTAKQLRGCP